MSTLLQIVLGLLGAIFYIGLLRRAFVTREARVSSEWFGPVDVAIALVLSLLLAWLSFSALQAPAPVFTEESIWASLVGQALFAGIILTYIGAKRIPLREFFGLSSASIGKSMLTGFVLMLVIFSFVSLLANVHFAPENEQEAVKFFRENKSLQSRLLLGFMAVVVAPIAEEMVFRGLLYRVFRGYFGKMSAMFFTSVLFAAIHGNVAMLLPLTILAMGFAAALESTGSLFVSIVMHSTFNAISLGWLLAETAI